jgi:hypothetical protein
MTDKSGGFTKFSICKNYQNMVKSLTGNTASIQNLEDLSRIDLKNCVILENEEGLFFFY